MPLSEGWAIRAASCGGLEDEQDDLQDSPGNSDTSCGDLAEALLRDAEQGATSSTHVIRLAAAAAKRDRKLGVVDPKVNKLARYRSSKSGKAGKNAARDFHRLLHRDGKLFPVTISTPMIPIRRKVRGKHGKRRSREKLEKFPCLVLSSWMEEILRVCPKFMCGGHDPCTQEGLQQVQHMFKQFWDDFKSVQPGLPIYQRTADEQMRTVPIAIHGDEGRGLGKTPILVLSYQLIIPHTGPDCLNMSAFLHHSASVYFGAINMVLQR